MCHTQTAINAFVVRLNYIIVTFIEVQPPLNVSTDSRRFPWLESPGKKQTNKKKGGSQIQGHHLYDEQDAHAVAVPHPQSRPFTGAINNKHPIRIKTA